MHTLELIKLEINENVTPNRIYIYSNKQGDGLIELNNKYDLENCDKNWMCFGYVKFDSKQHTDEFIKTALQKADLIKRMAGLSTEAYIPTQKLLDIREQYLKSKR